MDELCTMSGNVSQMSKTLEFCLQVCNGDLLTAISLSFLPPSPPPSLSLPLFHTVNGS